MTRTFLKCLIVSGGCLALFALAPAAFGLGFYNTVNVKDFGAVGDGVADDSAALEAVGRYLPTIYQMAGWYNHGAVAPDVIFPAGTYRITRTICWPGGYACSTPPPGGSGGYRMTGYHFMRGQGGATIRQDNASADIFFLSGAYRTFIDNITFQGGKRALKLTTYNADASNITIQNCRFQNSGDFAIECIVRRSDIAPTPDPGELDNFSMTEILHHYSRYDMYDNGTIRGYLDNSTTVPLYWNSTQMHVNNTQFTNCRGIAYSTCDGFYITNCTMDTTAAMTGPAIKNGGIMVIDNVTVMIRVTSGNGQYWIEHIAFDQSGIVIVRNSTLTTDSPTGVCPVYNRQKFACGYATTQKLVVLEDSTFQVSGCPENCVVYCTEVPNIISIRHCTNSGASTVPALGFPTVPTASYFTTAYYWFTPSLGLGYTVDASNTNITPNLPSSMVPYQRAPLPEAQDVLIRNWLSPNKEAFLSEAAMEEPGTVVVNVTTYGAKGDGSTDDTWAIRNAITAAGMTNSVELVFPAGRYCFNDTISLPARVTLRGQGCAAFIPLDMSKVCFLVNNAQRVAVYNCEFQQSAGALDVLISQPGAKILVKKCYFHWMDSGTAIRCVGGTLASDQTDLAKLRITDCVFLSNKVCLLSNISSIIDSTWLYNPFITTAGNAAMENYGSMRVESVLAVPNGNDYRWIRNYGRLLADSTRFSGESGGCCAVENRRVAGIPSNLVAIQNSWMYNTDSTGPNALVYCPTFPDQLILRTNEGVEDTNLTPKKPPTVYAEELPGNRVYFSGNTLPEAVKTATYVLSRPTLIPHGTATVDGDLSDWDNTTVWAPLDQDYYLVATDVPQAYYAARWTANKVYVAVKVQDTAQILMNSYNPSDPDSWNAADQIEVYLHTTGSYSGNTDYSSDQAAAQQYVVGIQGGNPNAVWSVLASGFTIPVSAGFQAAGRVNGQWLQYEVAMTPFQVFHLSGTGLVISPLAIDQVIGLDVVANSRRGPGDSGTNFGAKSENLLLDKYMNYLQIAPHRLGPQTSYTNVDLAAVLAAMDSTQAGGGTWNPDADFDNDLTITSSDLAIVLANLP